jgi:RimJ/RimL family protein N-acetyltransferase
VVGSVIFHGKPGDDGIAEIGYGVEESWQSQGFASEGTSAVVAWAMAERDVRSVQATTPPWHAASIRVLEKCGLVLRGAEEHETLGEVLRFARDKKPAPFLCRQVARAGDSL